MSELYPTLHDSHLVGIVYPTPGQIELVFTTVDKKAVTLRLSGVLNFFGSNLLEGNIVESVEVLQPDDIQRDDIEYFVRMEGRHQSVDHVQHTVRSRSLRMVLVTPSYGAELGCICDAVL